MTEQQVSCPRCRHENPPGNRFCGSCGVPLTSGEQLVRRQEHRPVLAARAWPCKIGTEEWSSSPAARDAGSASRGYLLGQSLEEVLLQAWEDSRGRVVARREVRSFVSTWPTGRRR
jgi:hypothetical protein